MDEVVLRPIGWVESPLTELHDAPHQADEGAPDAWLVLDPAVEEGLRDIKPGSDLLVLTWLDRATVLEVDANRLHVDRLEAVDGTPVLDLKPVLVAVEDR